MQLNYKEILDEFFEKEKNLRITIMNDDNGIREIIITREEKQNSHESNDNIANVKKEYCYKAENEVSLEEKNEEYEIKKEISNLLIDWSITAGLKGYNYLLDAIYLCYCNPDYLNKVTTLLYPTIAERHQSTGKCVERAIRESIKRACEKGNIETLQNFFSYSMNHENGTITNLTFIAVISNELRFRHHKNL